MKLHFNRILLLLPLSACAAETTSDRFDLLVEWNNRHAECFDLRSNNADTFPITPWFESLTEDDKRRVVLYLSELKMYQCTLEEASKIKQTYSKQDIQEMEKMFGSALRLDEPDKNDIEDLDYRQIELISEQISVFSVLVVAEQLNVF